MIVAFQRPEPEPVTWIQLQLTKTMLRNGFSLAEASEVVGVSVARLDLALWNDLLDRARK